MCCQPKRKSSVALMPGVLLGPFAKGALFAAVGIAAEAEPVVENNHRAFPDVVRDCVGSGYARQSLWPRRAFLPLRLGPRPESDVQRCFQ